MTLNNHCVDFFSIIFSDSLLLTPLCFDDIHDVTPLVSALAGCERLVSEPLVIKKSFRWGTIFPIGLKRYRDPIEEPIEKKPLMELKEIGSLIPLSHGSFDVIMGMDWFSKRKFVIVCHEKVVRIPLEGDETLRVHGKRTQGVVKTLMNTKVDEPKLSDISIIRDFVDVFPEDLSMTTTMKRHLS
ncbi:hypothetical protein Tco_0708900 [Tanacetum coccineum]